MKRRTSTRCNIQEGFADEMTKAKSTDMVDGTNYLESDCCPSAIPDLIPKSHISDRMDSGYQSGVVPGTELKLEVTSAFMDTSDVCNSFEQMDLSDESHSRIVARSTRSIESETRISDTLVYDDHFYEPDADGDTQLHLAVIHLLNPIAICLIQSAPSSDCLNSPNNLLQTPLHLAVIVGAVDVAHALLQHGANKMARDLKGDTPLHIACRKGFDQMVELLLNVGSTDGKISDLDSRNYDGQTCLHIAAENTYLSIITMLISKGANINSREGKSGRTVLHFGAESRNKTLLEFLLQCPSVDTNSKTYAGHTAIMLAFGRGFMEIFQILQTASGATLDWQKDFEYTDMDT